MSDPERTAERPSRPRRVWAWSTRPLVRMWESDEALDAYGLVHLASVAGDTLIIVALADSIFFSLPVGEAKTKVALYLALTMAPLAVAGPLLVPLLDRSPFRRVITFLASAGRVGLAVATAQWVSSVLLFPATFGVLVLSRIHAVVKNGLTVAYSGTERLVSANAFLGRVAVAAVPLASVPGVLILKLGSARGVLTLAAFVYAVSALLTLRLEPAQVHLPTSEPAVGRRGRLAELATAAAGAGGLRAAQGFLLALLAFALREEMRPPYWFGILAVAGVAGAAVGDLLAPRLPARVREEVLVIGSLVAAGVAALFAHQAFTLAGLALFAGSAGMASEFGRLGFQSLMQRRAPGGAQGRVFVRYEVAFQLAWVGGALIPALVPVPFRGGILLLAGFYLGLGVPHLYRLLRPKAE